VPDPQSLSATWQAAVAYRLLPRVGEPGTTAAVAQLLRRWHDEVAQRPDARDAAGGRSRCRTTASSTRWPPRSGHRCGYSPLWTFWHASPASRLIAGR